MLELEYAGLNVGKNKFRLQNFFFSSATNWAQSLNGGLAGVGSGLGKKTCLVNGLGPGHGSWPMGRVRVWQNSARTRPVAIPRIEWWERKSTQHLGPFNVV